MYTKFMLLNYVRFVYKPSQCVNNCCLYHHVHLLFNGQIFVITNIMAEIIKSGRKIFLHVDGFLFYRDSENEQTKNVYCKCRECMVRITTTAIINDAVEIKKKGKHLFSKRIFELL